jgi:dUTP pyrophosphatase
MEIKFEDAGIWDIPEYQSEGAAGLDLCANNKEPILIRPGERKLIHTGLKVAIPDGVEMQIRPRSGLVLKHGVTVLNSPGTIDSDYRGEIMVILYNSSKNNFFVNTGDRIAQAVFARYERVTFVNVPTLDETKRGAGGFGHTG